jgi:hypothetical protein
MQSSAVILCGQGRRTGYDKSKSHFFRLEVNFTLRLNVQQAFAHCTNTVGSAFCIKNYNSTLKFNVNTINNA